MGATDAARIVLRTLDSLVKLYGLDAPTRVAVGPTISETEFANEAARLIESIASLGGTDDLLRSLPGGAGHAVIDARRRTAVTEGNGPGAQPDSSAESQREIPPYDDDDEPWSNIGP